MHTHSLNTIHVNSLTVPKSVGAAHELPNAAGFETIIPDAVFTSSKISNIKTNYRYQNSSGSREQCICTR